MVLEEGGHPVSLGLYKRDPFHTSGCKFKDPECIFNGKKDCSLMGVCYVIRCNTCHMTLDPTIKEKPMEPGGISTHYYIGMTATSAHNRMLSHLQGHKNKSTNSVMHRHDVLEHNGEIQEYSMDCIATERRLLTLCMREALLIEGQNPALSINKKMEQGRGSLVRIAASR